jgi:hypothetical protein
MKPQPKVGRTNFRPKPHQRAFFVTFAKFVEFGFRRQSNGAFL